MVSTLAAVLALGAAACGGGAGETTDAGPPPPAPATPPPPAQSPPPAREPDVTTVRVVVRDGKVVGGLVRATVEQGEKVALVVSSDSTDEVHLHGYDRFADVGPGRQGRVVLVASIPGRFELELEERGLVIADLEVRP